MRPVTRCIVALLAVLAVSGSACSDSGNDEPTTSVLSSIDPIDTTSTTTTAPRPGPQTGDGEGPPVRLARGNWPETRFHTAVLRLLLIELGHTVTRPPEVSTSDFFGQLADAEHDLWPSTWSVSQAVLMDAEASAGGRIADHVTDLGPIVPGGALEGILVDRASVESFDLTTLDALLDDPEALAHFDRDGDGRADLSGCEPEWGCAFVIDDTITQNGWSDQLEQSGDEYLTGWDASMERLASGQPVLQYAWTPSALAGRAPIGTDLVWLALDVGSVLPEQATPLPEEASCTSHPCHTGFAASDISVTASIAFVEREPAAAALAGLVEIPLERVLEASVAIDDGEDTDEAIDAAAAEWIGDNRDLVEAWLATAAGRG